MSIAGVSFENCTYACFSAFVVMKVLTLVTFVLKSFSMASFMSFFVALRSTAKIILFSDSINRRDFSVDNGCLMTLFASIFR